MATTAAATVEARIDFIASNILLRVQCAIIFTIFCSGVLVSRAVGHRRRMTAEGPPSYGPAGVIFCDVNFACAMSHSAFTKNLHGCFDIPLGSLVALVSI